MSLRAARFSDYWRQTFSRNYKARLETIEYKNLFCLEDGHIDIPRGICAIVGGNGVGKSAILAAIAELLSNHESFQFVGHRARLYDSEISGLAIDSCGRKQLTTDQALRDGRKSPSARFDADLCWIEPSYFVNLSFRQIHSDANFSDLLEPLSPYRITKEEVEVLQYIIGKRIESCDVFELTEYGELDPFPYFVVTADGCTYGSEAMGQGELSLLYILWRTRTLPKDSVLVIEEPETHVSPRSQRALMDILAKHCSERGLSVVLTTHSPAIISSLPTKQLVLVARDVNGSVASVPSRRAEVNQLLGAATIKRALILVEDRAAAQFARSLLSFCNPDALSYMDFVDAGGHANIEAALKSLPPTCGDWFSLVGVFDGDMNGGIQPERFHWGHCFLPGESGPEELLMNSLRAHTDRMNRLGGELRLPPGDVRTALNTVEGLDPHDWFTQLPILIRCTHEQLMSALVSIWIESNADLAIQFVNTLIDMIETRPKR
tara:strand:- start:294 stop:1766 length:1473 start_codon:yes stop_codon:yes gene_type:complete